MSLVSFWYYSWLYAKPFDKDYHSYQFTFCGTLIIKTIKVYSVEDIKSIVATVIKIE